MGKIIDFTEYKKRHEDADQATCDDDKGRPADPTGDDQPVADFAFDFVLKQFEKRGLSPAKAWKQLGLQGRIAEMTIGQYKALLGYVEETSK